MATQTHIFLCQGPLSADAAGRIASSLAPNPGHQFHFLVSFRGSIKNAPPGSHLSYMSPAAESFSELERPFRIAGWFHAWLKEWEQILPGSIVYLSHPFEQPGNFFLLGGTKPKELHLLPDGLINYYDHSLRPETRAGNLRYRTRVMLRQAAARMHGLKYVPMYDGHLTQFERKLYDVTWTDCEHGMVTASGKTKRLPPRTAHPKGNESVSPGRLLILDQELHRLVMPALEREMREALISHAGSSGAERLYYKAHPRGKSRLGMMRQTGLSIEDASSDQLAEELIAQEGIDRVFGFYSTPLILAAAYTRERRAFLPTPTTAGVRKPTRLEHILSALEGAGASITRVGRPPSS